VLFARYNQNDQIKEDEMSRACTMNGVMMNACRLLVGKPKERQSHRWVDIIKMNFRKIG
jgi:hypothetical protein